MEDASMTSESVAEHEAVESAADLSAKAVDDQLIDELVSRAQAEGLQLSGEGGLLQQLTKRLLESALEGEITDHLGYDKHDPAGKNGANSRNGKRAKTVLTDVGPVEIAVPRDRDGSFEPKIVKKRQKRLTGVDEMVISLAAKGLTTGEVQAHLAEVYGAEVSRQTISTITDKVLDGMAEWQNRPLDVVYPVVFIDAIHVKIRDGAVANRPIYLALAVTAEGRREILGLWAGDGGEGAKHWLHILTEIKNRGVNDVLMLVCDGLKGLPEAVETVWPRTIVQTCVVHLLRNSFRYAARQDWTRSPASSSPSTQRRPRRPPWSGLPSSPTPGVGSIRRSSGSGRTRGRNSPRSCGSTPRSAASSAPPTRSSRSTHGSGERSGLADTSPTSRPR
jgi:putative transposase